MKKVSGGTTTVYIFSGTKVVAEYVNGAAPGSPTREYIYSGSALLAKVEGSATQYFHQDHLSNRVVTDSTGAIVEQKGHYPFGEAWYEGATPNKLKFTSYERDAESGNDYAMARYHVNRLGRFSSPDPIAGSMSDPQSLNRFAYVQNDPVNLIDPAGLFIVQVVIPNFVRINPAWNGLFDAAHAGKRPQDDPPGGVDVRGKLLQAKVFFQVLGRNFVDEFKEGGCVRLALATTAESFVSPGLSDLGPVVGAAYTGVQTSRALSYAASKGLTYPLKSSVFRGLAASASRGIALGIALRSAISAGQGLVVELIALKNGSCR